MSYDARVTSIILAGGQGSRLYPLTQSRSKPAVPIGGKFRLIDIPISNCLHADIRSIWIVTQFASESLHRHIFSTYRMDPFDKGFISILAASQTFENKGWYQGTADAVRKNLRFFKGANEHILILSGDHLYRMDYKKYVRKHMENDADITISVLPVEETKVPEFGILKMDKNDRITAFVEKPKEQSLINDFRAPQEVIQRLQKGTGENKTHMASMGIYLFKKNVLLDLLENTRYEDFGKQIIPESLKKYNVFAYPFTGYWEDIGTIRSFFEAHISLTKTVPDFDFYDEEKPIFTRPRFLPAAKINNARISKSIISEGSIIDNSRISNSVIGVRSVIEKDCELDAVIMMGNDYYHLKNEAPGNPMGIGKNSIIRNAIIDKNVRIGRNVRLINKEGIQNGEKGEIVIRDGICVVPKNVVIPDNFEF